MSALCHFTYPNPHLALFDQHSRFILPRFVSLSLSGPKTSCFYQNAVHVGTSEKRKTLNSFSLSVSRSAGGMHQNTDE